MPSDIGAVRGAVRVGAASRRGTAVVNDNRNCMAIYLRYDSLTPPT